MDRSHRGRGSRSGTRGRSGFATTARGTTAATAAAATATTALAAAAAMVMMEQAMAMAMATTAATAATASAAAALAATAASVTGNGHLLTAQQSDADNREEHRDAQDQSTVHPRILQTKNRYLGEQNMPSSVWPSLGTAAKRRSKIPLVLCCFASVGSTFLLCPV